MTRLLEAPETTRAPQDTTTRSARRRVQPINVNKALLLIRLVVGLLFIGHGLQKLLGWFGGPGMQAWTESLAKDGVAPAATWAYVSAIGELGSGALLVLGVLTPIASAVLIGDMLVAILDVHASKGLWSQNGGFEYNLVLITLLVCVGVIGPGLYSLDRRVPQVRRPFGFVGALVVTLGMIGLAVLPQHFGFG
jgi:putative oxidoreductase